MIIEIIITAVCVLTSSGLLDIPWSVELGGVRIQQGDGNMVACND